MMASPSPPAALRAAQDIPDRCGRFPLFGTDPLAAHQAAYQLQHSFTGHPEPQEPPP